MPKYLLALATTSNTFRKSFSNSKKKIILNWLKKKYLIKILKRSLEVKEDSGSKSDASSKTSVADNDPYSNFFGYDFEGTPKLSDDWFVDTNCQIFQEVPEDYYPSMIDWSINLIFRNFHYFAFGTKRREIGFYNFSWKS